MHAFFFMLVWLSSVSSGKTPRVEPAKPMSPQGVVPQHVMVYHKPGRFGGWPANHGIWAWGNEILVGFSVGIYKDLGPNLHAIDRDKPEEHLLARSCDGGLTWQIEDPSVKGALVPAGKALHGVAPPGLEEKSWRDCPGGIDFTHPDFAMTIRMSDKDTGMSRFYYSTDRGHNWEGPFRLPLFGQKGIAARTDYLVNGKHDCMLFLTAAKQNNQEGRVICRAPPTAAKRGRSCHTSARSRPATRSCRPRRVCHRPRFLPRSAAATSREAGSMPTSHRIMATRGAISIARSLTPARATHRR